MVDYSILIPAFNAEKTLPLILKQIDQYKQKPMDIFIVDDGSMDNTAKVSKEYTTSLIRLDQNRGKGYALRTGFEAYLKNGKANYLICMDADMQHPVSHIDHFLSAINEGPQFLIGSRSRKLTKMPLSRILSNSLTSRILTYLTKQNILDSQCGFRLIDRNTLQKLNLKEDGFQLESEMIIQASKINIPIKFISIPTIYNGNISNIHHISDTLRFIKLIIKELLK